MKRTALRLAVFLSAAYVLLVPSFGDAQVTWVWLFFVDRFLPCS